MRTFIRTLFVGKISIFSKSSVAEFIFSPEELLVQRLNSGSYRVCDKDQNKSLTTQEAFRWSKVPEFTKQLTLEKERLSKHRQKSAAPYKEVLVLLLLSLLVQFVTVIVHGPFQLDALDKNVFSCSEAYFRSIGREAIPIYKEGTSFLTESW